MVILGSELFTLELRFAGAIKNIEEREEIQLEGEKNNYGAMYSYPRSLGIATKYRGDCSMFAISAMARATGELICFCNLT